MENGKLYMNTAINLKQRDVNRSEQNQVSMTCQLARDIAENLESALEQFTDIYEDLEEK